MVYPDVKAEMADTFEEVAKRLNMEDLVTGIPVEQHDCTEAEGQSVTVEGSHDGC